MANTIEQGNNQLPPLDYSSLLKQILLVLENQNPFQFSKDGKRMQINVDRLAYQIATAPVENPLAINSNVRIATINVSSTEKFANQVRKIRERLRKLLDEVVPTGSVEEAIGRLLSDLSAFQGDRPALGFTYPFEEEYKLNKEQLNIQRDLSGSASVLKFHKLTITVSGLANFKQQVQASLENYIRQQFAGCSEDEVEELSEMLEDSIGSDNSDLTKLQQLVYTQSLGKLKREAKILYLEFLYSQIDVKTRNKVYLEDLIRRLREMEDYLTNPDIDYQHYQVSYEGTSVNYRDLFARAEALDMLPIIPIIEGNLGETKDENRGKKEFTFGLKLKFGNHVHSQGNKSLEVLDYYLAQIAYIDEDGTKAEHDSKLGNGFRSEAFKRRVLQIAFLYSFVFGSNIGPDPEKDDYNPDLELSYDPVSVFDQKILPVLQDDDEPRKRRIFNTIIQEFKKYNVKNKIDCLRDILKKLLKRPRILNRQANHLQIGIKTSILEESYDRIVDEIAFFKPVLGEEKKALKYIDIKPNCVDSNYFCNLPVTIAFEDIRYYRTEERQSFTMRYDIKDRKTMPVLIAPLEEDLEGNLEGDETCQKLYQQSFQKQPFILVAYNHQRLQNLLRNNLPSAAFQYKISFALLLYICLRVMLELVKDELFIPMMRLHLQAVQNKLPDEEFMRSLSKILSHLLSDRYQANSQGFNLNTLKDEKYRIPNALSSLYSVLPKTFQFTNTSRQPNLDKLAILIVSSKECDASWRRDRQHKLVNLLGEAIGIQRLENGKIRIESLQSFCGNDESQRMFQRPRIIIDAANQLYNQGFRQILYIAKAPYSSTLNLTQPTSDDDLFFMSKSVIAALKENKSDLKIYPIFYDKYYVVASQKMPGSMYVQNTEELTNLVADNKQVAVFFNLFNGIKVPSPDNFYNGVISYSTLVGDFYQGILGDKDINLGLIYDSDENSLKTDILQYLTLFHFSRYEKHGKWIHLKLDPYDNIIGDDAVSALSVCAHRSPGVEFHLLAFLTEVRGAFNVRESEN